MSKDTGPLWEFITVKRVLIIPPFVINNKLISDFEVKANYFNNSFFASQSNPLNNNIKIPEIQSYITNIKLSPRILVAEQGYW